MDRRRAKIVAEPLAKRAFTWPMAAGAQAQPASTKPRHTPRAQKNDWFSNVLKW